MRAMRVTPLLAGCAALFLLGLPSSRHAAAAPDNTRGMAMLSAMVIFVGGTVNLVGDTGATSVMKTATGRVVVTFDREVTNCFYAPAVSNLFGDPSIAASASAANVINQNNAVVVGVFDANGAPADQHFGLFVFCNR